MLLKSQEIVVVMASHMQCFREMMRGIGVYAKAKPEWKVRYFNPTDNYIERIQRVNPAGLLIGNLGAPQPLPESDAQVIKDVGHVVCVCESPDYLHIAANGEVTVDDVRAGELAAEYFLRKQYRSYAFVGFSFGWSLGRLQGFESELKKHGFAPQTLFPQWEQVSTARGWQITYPNPAIMPFLQSLPKPTAVFTCNDVRAREVVDACREADIRVPEDVAVLGMDNDQLDCELSFPPLSSVAMPWERIGYTAAHQLDQVMSGVEVGRYTPIPPYGITERHSTDIIAISDQDVSSALLFIREHAHLSYGIDDILKVVPVGRRTLEKKFKSILGRTVLEEIRRSHIDRAKDLLAQTDLTVTEVAEQSGFVDVTWFSTSFSHLAGISPLQYRKKFRK